MSPPRGLRRWSFYTKGREAMNLYLRELLHLLAGMLSVFGMYLLFSLDMLTPSEWPWVVKFLPVVIVLCLSAYEEIVSYPRRAYHVPWLWKIPADKVYKWDTMDCKEDIDSTGISYVGHYIQHHRIQMRKKGWLDILCHAIGAIFMWRLFVLWFIL